MSPKIFSISEKEDLRESMFHSGLELLKEYGMTHMSVDKIAASARIGKSTFYNLFLSKEDFVFQLKLFNEMSGGELQMVLIARALTIDPELLVLDERESNLDFKNRLIIIDTIRSLSENRGISAVVNTHYPEHALKISDKALVLNRDGTSIFGNAADVMNEENIKKCFSVRVYINSFSFEEQKYQSVVPLYLV